MTEHVVMFSGGTTSWAAAARVRARVGPDVPVKLLFTDTRIEDPDLYRFLREAADNVGGQLCWITEGRTPWHVFWDERLIGNTQADPCSKILKRQMARKWLTKHCDPEDTTIYFGITWDESHRFETMRERWGAFGWRCEAPMCAPPYLSKPQVHELLEAEGIAVPRLYALGFPHNNCGGFCVKGGQAHFELLLRQLPDVYAHAERREDELRRMLDKDVSILRDRRGGVTRPLTLREFRERIEAGPKNYDLFEWGGCGCFVDVEPATAST